MYKTVTFKQLNEALIFLGFEASRKGKHVTFKHKENGAVLTVPNLPGFVRPIYVITAGRQVSNSGIASRERFERVLNRVSSDKAE